MATELEELLGFLSSPSPPVSVFTYIIHTHIYIAQAFWLGFQYAFPLFCVSEDIRIKLYCVRLLFLHEFGNLEVVVYFINYLNSNTFQIKKAAVNIVRDYTGSEDGLRSLGKYSNVVLPSLSRLLSEEKVVVLYFFLYKFSLVNARCWLVIKYANYEY